MMRKPGRGLVRYFFQRAGFLEQVGGAGDDDQFFFAAQLVVSLAVEIDDNVVQATNQQ